MKTIAISGSASMEIQALKWKAYWERLGYRVLDWPKPIAAASIDAEYPRVFKAFFDHIAEAEIFFVMNEEKNGIAVYIGAAAFSELTYAIYLRMKSSKKPKIFLLNPPEKAARGSEE